MSSPDSCTVLTITKWSVRYKASSMVCPLSRLLVNCERLTIAWVSGESVSKLEQSHINIALDIVFIWGEREREREREREIDREREREREREKYARGRAERARGRARETCSVRFWRETLTFHCFKIKVGFTSGGLVDKPFNRSF